MTAHDIYANSAHANARTQYKGQAALWVPNGCTSMLRALLTSISKKKGNYIDTQIKKQTFMSLLRLVCVQETFQKFYCPNSNDNDMKTQYTSRHCCSFLDVDTHYHVPAGHETTMSNIFPHCVPARNVGLALKYSISIKVVNENPIYLLKTYWPYFCSYALQSRAEN